MVWQTLYSDSVAMRAPDVRMVPVAEIGDFLRMTATHCVWALRSTTLQIVGMRHGLKLMDQHAC